MSRRRRGLLSSVSSRAARTEIRIQPDNGDRDPGERRPARALALGFAMMRRAIKDLSRRWSGCRMRRIG